MDRVAFWVLWNVFLAVLPVLFARRLAHQLGRALSGRAHLWPAVALWAMLWLAFLPNSCYLLTEWRHWFDELLSGHYWQRWTRDGSLDHLIRLAQWTVFYAAFSGAGVLCFWAAVKPVAHVLTDRPWRPWAGAVLFWLNGLGVYLGLELRFNSWDLLHRPGVIFQQALTALSHPEFIVLVSAFALLLWLLYEVVETFAVGLHQRFGRREVAG